MSKVYDYHLEMEQLFLDADFAEWLAEQQLKDEDLEEMASEETKAQKFAKMMLEE